MYTKRFLCLFLTLCLTLGALTVGVRPAKAEGGALPGGLHWTLEDDVLTISGDGELILPSGERPWEASRETIREVIMSDGITSVSRSAFAYLSNLQRIRISNSLKTIPDFFCGYDSGLEEIEIPASVEWIGGGAFQTCPLKSLVLPPRLRVIGSYAFEGGKFESVQLPETLIHIGDNAFYQSSLKAVDIPSSVMYIGAWAFSQCHQLERVSMWDCAAAALYTCAFQNDESLRFAAVPRGTERLEYSFPYCKNLESVYLPASLQTVDENAFQNATGLRDVYYEGTAEDWEKIENKSEELKNAVLHTNVRDLLGDLDGTDGTTAADARLALRIAVELEDCAPGSARFCSADVDHDGVVTASDARLILRAAVELEDLKTPHTTELPAASYSDEALDAILSFDGGLMKHVETWKESAVFGGSTSVTLAYRGASEVAIVCYEMKGNLFYTSRVRPAFSHETLAALRVGDPETALAQAGPLSAADHLHYADPEYKYKNERIRYFCTEDHVIYGIETGGGKITRINRFALSPV